MQAAFVSQTVGARGDVILQIEVSLANRRNTRCTPEGRHRHHVLTIARQARPPFFAFRLIAFSRIPVLPIGERSIQSFTAVLSPEAVWAEALPIVLIARSILHAGEAGEHAVEAGRALAIAVPWWTRARIGGVREADSVRRELA